MSRQETPETTSDSTMGTLLKIYCIVDGGTTAFPIDISSEQSVGDLREKICTPARFGNIAPEELTLWQTKIPDSGQAVILDDIESKVKLTVSSRKLSAVFPSGFEDETVYIVVEPPTQGEPVRLTTLVSEKTFVQYIPDAITPFEGAEHSQASTTNRAYSVTPTSITPWNDFIGNVRNMQLAEEPLHDTPVFCDERRFSMEADIQEIFKRDFGSVKCLPPFAETFRCPGMDYGLPDLICLRHGGNVCNRESTLFPIEIKQPKDLNLNESLPDAATHQLISGRLTGPLDIVRQIFGYMYCNGFRYGILSTFNQTWFIVRREDDPNSILVSPSISFNDTSPTMLSCYLWFIREAESDEKPKLDPPEENAVKKTLRSEKKIEARRRKRSKGSLAKRLAAAVLPRSLSGGRRSSARSHSASSVDFVPAFKDMKPITFSNRARTFKALWRGEVVFVKKCDIWNERPFIDELQNEIEIYSVLRELQGIWIPEMKLEGIMNGFEIVLVTEYVGDNINNEHLNSSDCDKIRRALAAIHNIGILHGDIKPDNIVVKRDGVNSRFMIIDFGLSTFTLDKGILDCEQKELDSMLAALSQP
ncbi:hypothetical protein BGZ79_001634 [Entomortierella chlamydospora]|nr:hypothetical protein BGZ79_001634 [Entomortierella chlamydospora]